jgi:hypothetical protein
MSGCSGWWRRTGSALAALILTVLAFAPTLDSIVCHDEGGAPAASTADLFVATVEPAHDVGGAHAQDALDICIHGHCHHGSPYVPADPVIVDIPAGQPAHHALERLKVATSDPQFGLKRPPRA